MKNRRASLLVVPAVLAAMTLSACQDEAPTAAPPTPASQPPSPTQTQQPQQPAPSTQAPAPAPSTSEAPAPAPTTQTPSSSAAPAPSGSGAGGQCESSSLFPIKRGSVQPKPLNTPQTGTSLSDRTAEIRIGNPEIDTSGGDSYFPGDGMQTVIYPVTMKITNGSFIVARLAYGLVDDQDNPCQPDTLGGVLPKGEQFEVETVQEGSSLTKKIAFAVPIGADLSKYSVVFADDYNSGDAELAWTAK
ncbi:hypothetical protein FB554_0892 [Barrientosiimonas humi]|uniref:DUF4352 domain-containing protein n=1 Tax=Barrientosiimonas humi TaxID=999931 RepID=A0A542XAD1_9MICO|nr:hypothetical protein [Barrientosiimonas humi]TQL32760.1 hypothetical protein FB554_0892 [Barrientosiimonas humi]CAG7572751.1 hypothetical protein BH39T_PBIAJDOK_01374 [Barrientosiimonas humi]